MTQLCVNCDKIACKFREQNSMAGELRPTEKRTAAAMPKTIASISLDRLSRE